MSEVPFTVFYVSLALVVVNGNQYITGLPTATEVKIGK